MSTTKILITQSNYIPWKGYFDAIHSVDSFVIFDDMQYTKRDWRNRNKIKTAQGLQWLTIPVEVKGKFFQKINETKIAEKNWGSAHWKTIKNAYSRSKHFDDYRTIFEEFYLTCTDEYLTAINQKLIELVCQILGIKTRILRSENFNLLDDKNQRLINICKQLNGTDYFTGPAARDYIDETLFLNAGIQVHYLDYSNYPEYDQLYPPFEHSVSIVDLLFNEGSEAGMYLKTFNE